MNVKIYILKEIKIYILNEVKIYFVIHESKNIFSNPWSKKKKLLSMKLKYIFESMKVKYIFESMHVKNILLSIKLKYIFESMKVEYIMINGGQNIFLYPWN